MNERAIFLEALDRDDPLQRAAFVDAACAGDDALRQRVAALLKSHEEAGNFLGKLAPHRLAEELAIPPTDCETQGGTSVNDTAGDDLDFLAPSDRPDALGRLAHYEILEVIGRGGMGIVLRAFDEKLHRVVAIKVMAAQLATNAAARRRFAREAQAQAAVSHDHIVTIHAVEEAAGLPYLVMQCVAGMSLQERLDRDGPLELHEILRIGMQTASALAAAHAQGLIHRDIKPANILLENGVERVKITDFGLARAAADASLTQSGIVAGTPHYMSPEQARGDAVDQRTDLFSLGSVLYAMCTGRTPFRASGSIAVLKRVCEETPRPIHETNVAIPDWLIAIIDKLHAKDPAERYQSATEVADLLGRHLAHVQHPSVASLPGPTAPKPIARSRWVVATAVLVLALGSLSLSEATGVTNFTGTVIRIVTGEGTLIIEVADPNVQLSLDGEELTIRGGGVEQFRLRPGQYEFRAIRNGQPVKQELVTITRGGEKVVTVSLETRQRATVSVIRPRAVLREHSGSVLSLAFLEDGTKLATGSCDRSVIVWDTVAGTRRKQFRAHDGDVLRMTVSPDEKYLVTASGDGRARVRDTISGKPQTDFSGNKGWLASLAVSPQGDMVATGSGVDHVIKVWALMTGEVRATLPPHNWSDPWALAFSHDGQQLAAGYSDGQLVLWDVARQERRATVGAHGESIREIVYSPDGTMLATVSYDKTAKIWDPKTFEIKHVFLGHKERIHSVEFTPDSRTLVTAGGDWDWKDKRVSEKAGELLLWDVASGRAHPAETDLPKGAILCVRVSRDGKTVATAHADGAARLWNMEALKDRAPMEREPQAFFVLGGAGVAERKFDTLEQAVLAASHSDTIEIRGNGPWFVRPIPRCKRNLHIRAATGFQPVIKLRRAEGEEDLPLFRYEALLSLEGLEFQSEAPPKTAPGGAYLRGTQPLYVANCKFLLPGFICNWCLDGSRKCYLTNSEFHQCDILAGNVSPGAEWVVDNCVHGGADVLGINPSPSRQENRSIRISRCTAAGGRYLLNLAEVPLVQGESASAVKPLQVLVSASVFANTVLLGVNQSEETLGDGTPLPPTALDAYLKRVIEWRSQQNVHHVVDGQWIEFWLLGNSVARPGPRDLATWRQYWGSAETGSIEGQPRFQGGDLLGRIRLESEKVTPDDFRLLPDSPGYRAGKDGKDLGAEIDFVGPGAAYERWKQTPDYQEWLKETHQSLPAARPQTSSTPPPKSLIDALDPAQIPADERFDLQPKELVQVLGEHRGRPWVAPNCVAYRGDGKLAASGGYDGYVYLWDAERLVLQAMLEGHGRGKAVWCLAFLPDNRRLLSAGDDNLVRLWDVEAQRELRRFEGHTGVAGSVAVSHDGRRALTGAGDRLLRLWDIETGEEIRRFEGHTDRVTSVAFSPDDTQALSGSDDKTMRLWDVATGEQIRQFVGHAVNVRMVRFLPDGRRAVSCSHDKTVRLWNLQTGDELKLFEGHTGQVVSVDVSPDGQRAVSTGTDRSIRLWDLENGQKLRPVAAARGAPISTVAFSPDGRRVMSGEWYSVLRLWDLESGAELSPPLVDPIGGVGEIARVAFSADGSRVLACISHSDVARLFDVASARQLHLLKMTTSNNVALFSTDGREALCAGERGVTVWSVETGQELRRFEGASNISSVALSQDGRTVLTGDHTGPNGSLQVWQYGTGHELQRLRGHTGAIQSVALSADARRALSGGMDKIVRLWDLDSGSVLHQWQQSNTVWCVALSPDGRYAAASDDDGFVRLWDLSARVPAPRPLPRRHTRHVRAIAFSPDSRALASAGGDGRIVIWDTATGTSLREIRMPGPVMGLSYAPDGRHLAAANSNTTIYILRLAASENTATEN